MTRDALSIPRHTFELQPVTCDVGNPMLSHRNAKDGDDIVHITFLSGASLGPMPPKTPKVEGTRYLNIYEDDALEVEQLASSAHHVPTLPGLKL